MDILGFLIFLSAGIFTAGWRTGLWVDRWYDTRHQDQHDLRHADDIVRDWE